MNSLSKAFNLYLTHMPQDHCILQMRIFDALIKLRVMMRGVAGNETNDRLMVTFFFSRVVKHCERMACLCDNWLARAAEVLIEPGDVGDGGSGGGDYHVGDGDGNEVNDMVYCTDGEGEEVEADHRVVGGQKTVGGVGNAGNRAAEDAMGAEEVLDGPQLPPGVEVVIAGESEASEATESQFAVWESEKDTEVKSHG